MKKKANLESIVKELEKRKENPFILSTYLFDKQYQFVSDPSPFKIAVTSRRSGKSVSCAADLIFTCNENPEVVCLYITLSRSSAKRIIWPELKRICRKFTLNAKFNESDLSIEFIDNGSMLYCSGAADKSEIEKFRGLALKKVYVDECQSFPSYLEDLIDDVLSPALMDHAGSLSLIGTPGPIPSGFFFNASRSSTWAHHVWTFWDNPYIASKSGLSHNTLFDRELKRRGVTKDNPSVQREWFGNWILDTNSLVFKYDVNKNDYTSLPKLNNFIMGVDIGYDDADAIAVLGWHDKDKKTYLVEEKITRHQGITALVEQIEEIKKRYDITKIVIDTAGLGKKIAEEIIRRHKISVVPAEKSRKLEYIELMNDALRTSQLMIKASSTCADDFMRVEWDLDRSTPDKMRISDRFHSDICDAVLYAWRESYSFTHEAPKASQSLRWGSPEWAQQEQEKLEEQAQEFFEAEAAAEKSWEELDQIFRK